MERREFVTLLGGGVAAREAKGEEYDEYQILRRRPLRCCRHSDRLACWYAPGAGLAGESVPFISSASPGIEASARTYLELEARASATPGIEFVALRYGFFYGPGTWYTREGDIGDQVRQQQVPIIGEGQGVYSFVHIDDAAGATSAAL